MTLAALGVVYGDIGTSPLYAAKETFSPDHGIALDAVNVLGGLSTIFWSLMIVVSLQWSIGSFPKRRHSREMLDVVFAIDRGEIKEAA